MANCIPPVRIVECFVIWCALWAVSTQARSLQRIHRNHHAPAADDSPRVTADGEDSAIRLDNELANSHNSRSKHPRHHSEHNANGFPGSPGTSFRPFDDHHAQLLRLSSSRRWNQHAIRKRQNKVPKVYSRNLVPSKYEAEIKTMQNNSVCDYDVLDIPDRSEDGSRIPKKLTDIKCKENNQGGCNKLWGHCCVQTYSSIDVIYSRNRTGTVKIYTGCVCSKRDIPMLDSHPINLETSF